jgi:cell division protein FtsI (penicillin-binding protein 3)
VQADGEVLVEKKPEFVRQVLSADVAHALTRMMVGVTEKGGTGVKAAIAGIEVAGKTGTAQKADPITHAYGGKRFSSFMGFAPANDPKVAVYVAFDEPQGEKYGGDVAAPVFKAVATAALLQLGVAPSTTIPPPPVLAEKDKKNSKVKAPPKVETAEADEGFDEFATESGDELTSNATLTVVPDVKGCSARSSLRLLHDRALEVEFEGYGRVTAQHPEPGRQVPAGTPVHIMLGSG